MAIEYLNNKLLEQLISNFRKAKKKKNLVAFKKAEEELAEAFYILAENIVRAFNFQMIEPEDMIQEGVMICFEKLDKFDPNYVSASGNKSKSFNYLTTILLNSMRQNYRTAKNYKLFKEKYFEFNSRKNQDYIGKNLKERLDNQPPSEE